MDEDQEQLKLQMEMEEEAQGGHFVPKHVDRISEYASNPKNMVDGKELRDADMNSKFNKLEQDQTSAARAMINSATSGMAPRILNGIDSLTGDTSNNWGKTYQDAADDNQALSAVTAMATPNPFGKLGAIGRVAGTALQVGSQAANQQINRGKNDAAQTGLMYGGGAGAVQAGLEAGLPIAGRAIVNAMPVVNRAGNSILAKFLGIPPAEIAHMAESEVDDLLGALGLPKNAAGEGAVLSQGASREEALRGASGLADDLGAAKGQVIDKIPPAMSDDVANSLDAYSQNPRITGAEAQYGVPRVNEMSSRYSQMGTEIPGTPAIPASPIIGGNPAVPAGPASMQSNPIPMSMLAKESSELGNSVFSGGNPSAMDKMQNVGTMFAKNGIDEIINGSAQTAGVLPDLQAANLGASRAYGVRDSLTKAMTPSSEGATVGTLGSGGGLLERALSTNAAQRLTSTAGVGAKKIAADLLYRLPNTQMHTPDLSRIQRTLELIMNSQQPEVDMEVASYSMPEFLRYMNESREEQANAGSN